MTDLAVLMSVYHNDDQAFVRESVESILGQTFQDFHFYISFDGPVRPEVDKYLTHHNDNRIRLFKSEQNGGLAKSLNSLLEIVLQNPYYALIARMDADDISDPFRFEKQRNYLSENMDIAIVGCWYEEIDESGTHLSFRSLPVDHESLRKRYFTRTPFAHPSVMFRRELIEKAGLYPTDTMFMEDNVLWGRTLKAGMKFGNIPEYLIRFRMGNSFYRRRSGVKYGLSFIRHRFKVLNLNRFPWYTYLFSISIGIVRMLPPYILRYFYKYV